MDKIIQGTGAVVGRDLTVVGFTTTDAISAYLYHN